MRLKYKGLEIYLKGKTQKLKVVKRRVGKTNVKHPDYFSKEWELQGLQVTYLIGKDKRNGRYYVEAYKGRREAGWYGPKRLTSDLEPVFKSFQQAKKAAQTDQELRFQADCGAKK